jgi:hypothetical protein
MPTLFGRLIAARGGTAAAVFHKAQFERCVEREPCLERLQFFAMLPIMKQCDCLPRFEIAPMNGRARESGPSIRPSDNLLSSQKGMIVLSPRRFWRGVATSKTPRARVETVRIVDMCASNSWAQFASVFCATRSAFLDHERAKSELKALIPEDVKEASGHGIRAKRSKPGAVSFHLFAEEDSDATV